MINWSFLSRDPSIPEGAIKFDYHSGREYFFYVLCGIGVALMAWGVLINNFFGWQFLTGLFSAIIFGIISQTLDDYIVIDPAGNSVIKYEEMDSSKSNHKLCSLNSIEEVRIESFGDPYLGYVGFVLVLIINGKKLSSTNLKFKMSVDAKHHRRFPRDHFFDPRIRHIITQGLKIAKAAGCTIAYSERIPPEERKQ